MEAGRDTPEFEAVCCCSDGVDAPTEDIVQRPLLYNFVGLGRKNYRFFR
jgi:hypothetical protein